MAGDGCNVLGVGEMGIGNTASAALITHALTGAPLIDCVGRGTGLNDSGLARKRELMAQAVFVTGGAGFVGRRLLVELRRAGRLVVALDRSGELAEAAAGAGRSQDRIRAPKPWTSLNPAKAHPSQGRRVGSESTRPPAAS